jgi:hypothetical protein
MNRAGVRPTWQRDDMNDLPRIEYIEARRVLLDVLCALREQLDAVALVGAQAVYCARQACFPHQPFTTDAVVLNTSDR